MKTAVAFLSFVLLLIVVVGVLGAWLTMYRYDSLCVGPSTRYPVRIHRLTGRTEILDPSGWKAVPDAPSTISTVALPADELKKLAGDVSVSPDGRIYCRVYNGSRYALSEITISAEVLDSKGTAVPRRLYRMPYSEGCLDPLRSGSFSQDAGLGAFSNGGQKLSWEIAEAKGVARK